MKSFWLDFFERSCFNESKSILFWSCLSKIFESKLILSILWSRVSIALRSVLHRLKRSLVVKINSFKWIIWILRFSICFSIWFICENVVCGMVEINVSLETNYKIIERRISHKTNSTAWPNVTEFQKNGNFIRRVESLAFYYQTKRHTNKYSIFNELSEYQVIFFW